MGNKMEKNKLEIYWNLGNLLYQRKILKVTEFKDLMILHGVPISYAQAHALVNEQPLRVTLRTVLAICEALNCSVDELIVLRKATEKKPESAPEEKTKATILKRIPKKLIGRKLKFD